MNIEVDEIKSLVQEYENLKGNVRQSITFGEFSQLTELIKIRKLLEQGDKVVKTTKKVGA